MTPTAASVRKAFVGMPVLVIGDLMLDRYLWGKVSRVSPEAPVPVVDITEEEARLGGAANVGLNLAALGAKVFLCGVIGQDPAGDQLQNILEAKGFDHHLVIPLPDRRTTAKTRIIAQRQHVLRVDREDRHPLHDKQVEALLHRILPEIPSFKAIVLEDYDKGMLSPKLIHAVISEAARHQVPVCVDPKYAHFFDYGGCTLFKPNLKELNEALGLRLNGDDHAGIVQAVVHLRARMPHTHTLVTLSEHGMLAVDQTLKASPIPAHFRKITDVSGAGDTVVSLMAAGLGCGLPLPTAAALANLGGGLVCEEVGVATVDPERLFAEALRLSILS